MALDKLTKIDGGGISTTSDYRVGVITATKFVGPFEGTITSTDATFTGNVSIAGTLTYEDVTNIDSVGVITARDGIFLPDNKKLELGNASGSADLTIHHDGSTASILKSKSGDQLSLQSDLIWLRNSANNESLAKFTADGAAELYYDNLRKLSTISTGIKIHANEANNANIFMTADEGDDNGDQWILQSQASTNNFNFYNDTSGTAALKLSIKPDGDVGFYGDLIVPDNITHSGDTNTKIRFPAADTITAETAGSERLRITSDGKVGIGTDNPLQKLHVTDGTSANIYIETKKSDTGSTAGLYYKTSSSAASDFFKTGIVLEDDGTSYARGKLHILQNNTADGSNATLSDSVVTFAQDGKVGIGTAPSTYGFHVLGGSSAVARFEREGGENWAKVDIKAGTSAGNSYLTFSDSDASEVGEINYEHADDSLRFNTNSAERLRITATGEVNIGGNYTQTTNKLNVTGDAYVSDDIIVGDEIRNNYPSDFWASDNTFINLNGLGNITHMGGYELNITSNGYRDTNGQWVSYNTNSQGGAAQIGLTPTGEIRFRTDASKADGTAHNPTTRVVIDSSGRVFIGGNSNSASSHADELQIINTSAQGGLSIINASNGQGNIYFGHSGGTADGRIEYSHQADYMRFHTANAERLRITSGGNVGIGTVTPSEKLDVRSGPVNNAVFLKTTSDKSLIEFENSAGATYNTRIGSATLGGGNVGLLFETGTSSSRKQSMVIDRYGKVGITSTAPTGALDIRTGDHGFDGFIKLTKDGNYNPSIEYYRTTGSGPTWYGAQLRLMTGDFTYSNSGAANLGSESYVERVRITSSGNVGINSTAPTARLDVFGTNGTIAVFGDSRSDGPNFECIKIKNDVAGYPAITNDSTPDTLDLRSFGSVQATIDSNNNSTSTHFRVMTNGTGNSGTELFKVDDNGYVTKPANPMFQAGMTASRTISSNGWHKIQYDTDTATGFFDVGGNFDASSHRFTAPVTGYYHFSCNQRFDAGNNQYFRLCFYKNGSAGSGYPYGMAIYRDADTFAYVSLSISSLIQLDANDYVEAWAYSNTDTSWTLQRESQFSGYLVG